MERKEMQYDVPPVSRVVFNTAENIPDVGSDTL